MFHLGGDDVPLGVPRASRPCLVPLHERDARGTKCSGDGGIIALRRAGGKNHVRRGRVNQLRHLFARGFLNTVHSPQFTGHSKSQERLDC